MALYGQVGGILAFFSADFEEFSEHLGGFRFEDAAFGRKGVV